MIPVFGRLLVFLFLLVSTICRGQEPAKLLATFSASINDIAVIDAGNLVLIAAQNEIYLVGQNGEVLRSCKIPFRQVTSLEGFRDEKQILVAGGDPGIDGKVATVWTNSLTIENELEIHDDTITSLVISPDGQRLATASLDENISVFEMESSSWFPLKGHSKGVTGVTWIDDRLIVSVAEDMSVRVWDREQQRLVRRMNQHVGGILGVQLLEKADSPQPVIVTWGRDRTVRFWQPATGRMIRFASVEGVPICCDWNSETQQVIIGDSAGCLNRIDWRTGKVLRTERISDDWIISMCYHQKTGVIYAGTSSGKLFCLPW